MQPHRRKKKSNFAKEVVKDTKKGLGKLAGDVGAGVINELASILTLGWYKPPKR